MNLDFESVAFWMISDNSLVDRKSPWLFGVGSPHSFTEACIDCGAGRWPPGPLDLPDIHLKFEPDRGCYWPDVIGHGDSTPGLIMSERIARSWISAGLDFGELYPCKPAENIPKRLQNSRTPRYFLVPGLEGIDILPDLSGVHLVQRCPRCGHRKWGRQSIQRFIFDSETWSKRDLFYSTYNARVIFCTKRVVELARRERHTNLRFFPSDFPWSKMARAKPLDYLGKEWPPKMTEFQSCMLYGPSEL